MGAFASIETGEGINSPMQKIEYGFEDSDNDEELLNDYSNDMDSKSDEHKENKKDTDSKSDEPKENKKEIDIEYLEHIDEQEIFDSVNNESKDGEFSHVDCATQRKYLNFICYKNQKWLSPDLFYSECCSNLKQAIEEHIQHEEKKKLLFTIITSLQNKKPSLKSKTHQKCNLLKEIILKTKTFTDLFFHHMANCFHKMLVKFLKEFFKLLYSISIKLQHLTLTVNEIYHMIQSLPILKHILPKTIATDSVLPPKDGFSNWSFTIQYETNYMPFLKNVNDVQSFIKKCNNDKKQCRFVSYGHSFSPMFGDNGTYTGQIIDKKYTGVEPPLGSFSDTNYENKYTKAIVEDRPLMFVELLPNNQIRVGGATSNYLFTQLQRLRYFDHGNLLTPSEPCNTVQHFQGYGGTHAVGCHGSGINTTSLSCYVQELKILDAFGVEHVYNQLNDLKTIATHFGLLGFVTEMTLQYDKPYFALFNPKSEKLETYFPRNGECKQFQHDVCNNYYNEFFWYPTQKNILINVWERTFENEKPNEVEAYPSKTDQLFHITATSVMETFNTMFPMVHYKGIYAKIFQSIITSFAQVSTPSFEKPKKVLSCDALHFIWGIQNIRVLDMEWSIPLKPLKKEGKNVLVDGKTVPDCTLVRDLVWACHDLVHEYQKKDCYPQVLPLEFRILRGNDYNLNCGSNVDFICTIEVLTIVGTNDANKMFYDYCQELTDKWAKIAGVDAKFMRPHWGKLWQNFTILGKPVHQHLKETYGEQWKKFEEYRSKHDPKGIFLNKAFRTILDL